MKKQDKIQEELTEKQLPSLDLSDDNELLELVKNEEITPEEKQKILQHSFFLSISRNFSGPIPPPEALSKYDQIIENGAERIFKNFEDQSSHRREIESKVIGEQLAESKRGQYFAFILAILFLGASVFLALQGLTAVACVLGGTTVVGLVGAFISGKIMQKDDLKDKDPE